MAAEVGDQETSFRRETRIDLDRRRPSKRQTTVRSFKVIANWVDGFSQASVTSTRDAVTAYDQPRQSKLSLVHPSPTKSRTDTSPTPSSPTVEPASCSTALVPNTSTVSLAEHQTLPATSSTRTVLPNIEPAVDDSPSSIVLATPAIHLQAQSLTTDERMQNDRTPPLDKTLSEKTPLSGHSAIKTRRSRKRRKSDADSSSWSNENSALEKEYRENNFVRIFNADQRRKNSVSEITELDVILTAVEEEALEVRNEIELAIGKQAVKEFFIQMRKSFSETIDTSKENQMLKVDLRKAKSKVNRLKKELLKVQQKRSSITSKLSKERGRCERRREREQRLESFSAFLTKLEVLHKECTVVSTSKKQSKQDAPFTSLPSLLIQGHNLLTAVNQLKSVHDSLQKDK